jgi:hypothetical protein
VRASSVRGGSLRSFSRASKMSLDTCDCYELPCLGAQRPDKRSRHRYNRRPRLAAVSFDRFPCTTILEAIMKAIPSMALLLGVCGLAGAADEKANPVGTWQCEYEIGGAKRTSTLTVKKEGDKFVGTMNWPDQKDEKIKDPKFKDGTLTFSAERKIMGNTIPIDYTLTIDGDKLKGKGASEFGGQKQEWDIEGKREKKDK